MSTEPFDLTDAKLAKLLRELTRVGDRTLGDCFTDEESIEYVTEAGSKDRLREMDAHLAVCPPCCEDVKRLSEAAGPWLEKGGAERLARLRETLAETWLGIVRQERTEPTLMVPTDLKWQLPVARSSAAPTAPSRASKRVIAARVVAAAAAIVVAALAAFAFNQNRRLDHEVARLRVEQTDAQRREQELREQLARVEAAAGAPSALSPSTEGTRQARTSAPVVIAVTLTAGTSRSAESPATPPVVVPRTAAWLGLTLVLERDDYPAGYAATVETVEGAAVDRVTGLRSVAGPGGQKSVTFRVPAQSIAAGDYVVRLDGLNESGAAELAANYTLRLERLPR